MKAVFMKPKNHRMWCENPCVGKRTYHLWKPLEKYFLKNPYVMVARCKMCEQFGGIKVSEFVNEDGSRGFVEQDNAEV